MTVQVFRNSVQSTRYGSWKFSPLGEPGDTHGMILIDAMVPRARHGGRFLQQWMSPWLTLKGMRQSQLARHIRDTIASLEEHERCERLRINGRRPFNPHGGD